MHCQKIWENSQNNTSMWTGLSGGKYNCTSSFCFYSFDPKRAIWKEVTSLYVQYKWINIMLFKNFTSSISFAFHLNSLSLSFLMQKLRMIERVLPASVRSRWVNFVPPAKRCKVITYLGNVYNMFLNLKWTHMIAWNFISLIYKYMYFVKNISLVCLHIFAIFAEVSWESHVIY